MSTLTETFESPIAPPSGLASPALAVAAARVTNYLVRSGWGDQPAAQRAERLVRQVVQREGDALGEPDQSDADLSRLVRLAIAVVCQSQSDDVRRSVIRPALPGQMGHADAVRRVGPLRADWWTGLFRSGV